MLTAPSRRYAVCSLPPDFTPQRPDLNNSQPKHIFANVVPFIMRLLFIILISGAYFLLIPSLTIKASEPDKSKQDVRQISDDASLEDAPVVLIHYVFDRSPLAGTLDVVRQARPVALVPIRSQPAIPATIALQKIAHVHVAGTVSKSFPSAEPAVQVEEAKQVTTEPVLVAVSLETASETVDQPQAEKLADTPSQPEIPGQPAIIKQPAPETTLTEQSQITENVFLDVSLAPDTPIQHIVLISIDGLRPDALAMADTPNLDDMISSGAYCPHAQTVDPSMTLPSHASMLSGMVPDKHGIHWNSPYIGWPGMTGPTVFNILNDMGYTSAMVYGKEKLNYIVLPNGAQSVFAGDVHDPIIRNEALRVIEEGLPNLLFVHFPDTDRVGHDYGWMSENQLYAVNFVDGLIGELVSAVEAEGHKKNTLWIVTADHGGHGFLHGDDSPFDRTIPWLATGPGVPSGISLDGVLNTYDTAATILYAFDIPIPDIWDGKPVMGIFQ